MDTTVEGTHQVGNFSLFTKTWKPTSNPVAKLIFIHGFNDHIDRYYELFPSLASRGIEVHGFDQRGWGRSVHEPYQKGLTGPTETVIGDIVSFISFHLPSPVPLFVMGHSMGGGETLFLACNPRFSEIAGQIRGWLLESPFIGFAKGSEPNSIFKFFGRLAAHIFPGKQLYSALPAKNLSRDPEVVVSLENDPLLHGFGTLEGLSGMLDRTADLSSGRLTLNKEVQSIWFGHGTADKATSYQISKKWFEDQCGSVKDKEFKTYDGVYHQIHADLLEDRKEFYEDVGNWILNRAENRVESNLKL